MKLETALLKKITQKQVYKNSFAELIKNFHEKLSEFNPVEKAFEIEKYFLKGGIVSIRNKLIKDLIISKDWLYQYQTKKGKINTDFKGLYIFFHGEIPIYVGISKGVINRILQHVKGHSHQNSTLAYNIAILRHEILNGEKYSGIRKDFDFKVHVSPVKEFLLQQKIAFLPIENSEELYLFEIFCAMELQCWLNKFETH